MNSLERLKEIGFQEAGHFYYTEKRKNNLDVEIPDVFKEKCLYAFVVEHEVKYVGSTVNFKQRIDLYCVGNKSQSTNKEIHDIILGLLENKEVKIYVWKPDDYFKIETGKIKADFTKAFEYNIIQEMRKLNDLWNKKDR